MRWFSAKNRIVVLIEGIGAEHFMDCVHVFRAADFDDAFQTALRIGKSHQQDYLNGEGRMVRWRLQEIVSLAQIGRRIDGAEVHSEFVDLAAGEEVAFEHVFHPEDSTPDDPTLDQSAVTMSDEPTELRRPSPREMWLLRELVARAGAIELPSDWIASLRVQDMEDGGMGSIRLAPGGTPLPGRVFGRCAAELELVDADGVPVLVSLNVDREGRLFELDVWKADYSPLRMSETIARIRWLGPTDGGPDAPPPGPRYSTVARFAQLADRWPEKAWSVVLDIATPADADGVMVAAIRMLAADAPPELLTAGSRFELYEGTTCVARGEVL